LLTAQKFSSTRASALLSPLKGGAVVTEKAAISGACLGWCASSVTTVPGEKFVARDEKVTGWPKDKHSLSTGRKVFSCKWPAHGLAPQKPRKTLFLMRLKPVEARAGLWITVCLQRRANQTSSGAFGKRQELAAPNKSL
jgi:hypothetical protein